MNSKLEELKKLPVDERIELVQDLWDTIAQDQIALPVTRAQKDELDRRLASYKTDGALEESKDEVIASIRQNL